MTTDNSDSAAYAAFKEGYAQAEEAKPTSLQDTLPKLSQSAQRLQGVIEEAKAAGGGGVSTIYNAYSFDYIPYAIKIEGGDNEHPVNYGVVKVYNRLLEETSVFIEEKEVNRLQADLAAERARVAGLLAALEPFANAAKDFEAHVVNASYDLNFGDFISEFYSLWETTKIFNSFYAALEAVAITGSGEGGE